MTIWLLLPIERHEDCPWKPWYDKCFGYVIISDTEDEARQIADERGGDETVRDGDWKLDPDLRYKGQAEVATEHHPWLNPAYSSCVALGKNVSDLNGFVLQSFAGA